MSEYLYLISKAERDADYRGSALHFINPRSKTEVKRGTTLKRTARFGGGAVGGNVAGTVAGRGLSVATRGRIKAPIAQNLGGQVGTAVGATVGRSANISSGDVRATNRRSGKQAKGGITLPVLGSVWRY